jgi:hypothetical protein
MSRRSASCTDDLPGGPKVLWAVPVGQGYPDEAIVGGRVYLMTMTKGK